MNNTGDGKLYIQDPTIQKGSQFVYFNTLPEVVMYLDKLCQRHLKKNRKQLMNEFNETLGGYDDEEGLSFIRVLSDHLNMGIVKNGRHVNCDIVMKKFDNPGFGT
jgi:hypothetical protein